MELFKYCRYCEKTKEIEEFQVTRLGKQKIVPKCKSCIQQYAKNKYQKQVKKDGGSPRIKQKPNTYVDKYQKEQTFQFMQLCGWQYNEENGIWWKELIKDKNGNWYNIKPIPRKPRVEFELVKQIYMYRQNNNTYKTSKKFAVSQQTVRNYVNIYKKYLDGENRRN